MRDLMKCIESNAEKYVKDLRRICQKPSISAQKVGMDECAETLREMMQEVGVKARIVPVKDSYPVVFGELKAKDTESCVGFYNHYDVQPPEPLELWDSPPFEAEIRDGKIFARGVSDNKGNVIARLKAVEAILDVMGEVPINLKFFVEGEEEIGSPHLPTFVRENMDLLKAEGYLWEGDGVDEKDRPMVSLGAKGILYVELEAKGAKMDVHSSRAPLIPNPAWRLVWALASLKGPDEGIRIPGWYEGVTEPTEEEKRLLKEASFEEEEEKRDLGLKEFLGGLSGVESRRALYFSPTCTICGFGAGYTGPGSKTVLPSVARAKVDFRMVGTQRPDELFTKLKDFLKKEGFGDIKVTKLGGYEPAKTSVEDPFAIHVIETARKVYGVEPVVWPTSAGTSPIYTIRNWMGIPVASAGGAGHPESNAHAPNENIRIKDYIQSIKYIAKFIITYSGSRKKF